MNNLYSSAALAAAILTASAASAQHAVIAPASGSADGVPLFTLGDAAMVLGDTDDDHLSVGHTQGEIILYTDDTTVDDSVIAEGDYSIRALAGQKTLRAGRPVCDDCAVLRIFTLEGARAGEYPLRETSVDIDLSDLRSGVYAVVILSSSQIRKSAKFILK